MAQGRPLAESGRGATTPSTWVVEPMSKSDSAAQESAATTHGIDEDRYVRAVVETMTVTELGPATYEVAHEGESYGVDLREAHCTCPDHEYRDARCKHLVRAALFAAFTEGVRTRFTAAVVRASDDFGCAEDHAECAGPTGDTLPCPTCVAGTSTGHWSVWCVAVDGRPAREVTPDATADTGEGVATDGGTDTERVWHADCRDCGWQRTVDSKDRAEELRCKHEGIAHDDEPTWHTVERRWERVATDGGERAEDTTRDVSPCPGCGSLTADDTCGRDRCEGADEIDETPL